MKKFLCLFLLLTAFPLWGIYDRIKKNKGIPLIANYNPKNSQNWACLQDQRGFMYFANGYGVLEYDGKNFDLIPTANQSSARSLALAPDGCIYVGAIGDIGYLKADEKGKICYQSLVELLPLSERDFKEVHQTLVTPFGIVFHTFNKIFIYRNQRIKVINSLSGFHFAYEINKRLFIEENGKGLYEYRNDKLNFVQGSEIFADDKIYTLLSYDEHTALVASLHGGRFFFNLDNNGKDVFRQLYGPTDDFLIENEVYCGTKIGKNYYAYGTAYGGVIVTDNLGDPVMHLTREKGLQTDDILSLFPDNQGNLWIGMYTGIARVELASPFTFYEQKSGLNGSVEALTVFNEHLFAGTSQAVYEKNWEHWQNAIGTSWKFNELENTRGQNWSFLKENNYLLSGHNAELLIINLQNKAKNVPSCAGNVFMVAKYDDNILLALSYYDGIIKIDAKTGKTLGKVPGFDDTGRTIIVDKSQNIWISNELRGIYRLRLNKELTEIAEVTLYDSGFGLPYNEYNKAVLYENDILAVTDKGIYKYNAQQDSFNADPRFEALREKDIFLFTPDNYGNIWYHAQGQIGFLSKQSGGGFSDQKTTFRKIDAQDIRVIFPKDSSDVFFGTANGIIHYDPTFCPDTTSGIFVTVRKVEHIDSDLVHFAGAFADENGSIKAFQTERFIPSLVFKQNAVRFSYAALVFADHDQLNYRYKLEGFDKDFSKWTEKTEKDYTNLPKGHYKFLVEAKDIYGRKSEPFCYELEILPPWFETWWFYGVQVFGWLGLLCASIWVNRKGKHDTLSKVLTYITVITIFRFLTLAISPLISKTSGGIPIFAVALNILMALCLMPIETAFKKFIKKPAKAE